MAHQLGLFDEPGDVRPTHDIDDPRCDDLRTFDADIDAEDDFAGGKIVADREVSPWGVRPMPLRATEHLPGTDERVAVYAQRYESGYDLYHPDDYNDVLIQSTDDEYEDD